MLRDRILFFRRVFLTGRLGITRRKDLAESKIRYTFAPGEMAERSIAAVLKTVELQGSGGSNPSLSAECMKNRQQEGLSQPLLSYSGVGVAYCVPSSL